IFALSAVSASAATENSAGPFASALQLMEIGQNDKALEHLVMLSDDFAARNLPKEQAEALLYAGQLYMQSGRYAEADAQLTKSAGLARNSDSRIVLAKSLNLLGSLLIGVPYSQPDSKVARLNVRSHQVVEKDRGLDYMTEALLLAKEQSDPHLAASILNNQGNLYAGRSNFADARNKFLEALALAQGSDAGFRASILANLSTLCVNYAEYGEAERYAAQAFDLISPLPFSGEKVNVLIKSGNTFLRVARNLPARSKEAGEAAHLAFKSALLCADGLKDEKARGYALGYDGTVYENAGEVQKAFDLTRKALFAAQLADSREQLALWQWQLARLHSVSGNEDASLAAYKRALSELQQLKQSAPTQCGECAISFKEFTEPVYKGLLDSMFSRIERVKAADMQKSLAEIRDAIESFRTAELQDFFKDACVTTRHNSAETFSTPAATALVYYTILPKRLEILVQYPSGFKRYTVNVDSRTLAREVAMFRSSLSLNFGNYLTGAKRLYGFMLSPLQDDLAAEKIGTLVIVPDGALRTIPVTALHDGKEFVIAKYAVAVTQGVQLTDTSPVSPNFRGILMAGISESVFDFPALPSVTSELSGIAGIFGGTTLYNSDFKIAALKSNIEKKPYSIIHLATHGEFAGDINNMFILAFDGLVKFDQLDRFIRVTKYKDTPLELLTLSACKTATGDDRAVLGLAGIAVKAGAKSTMATLWEIDDKATSELIVEFYRQLKTAGISKSQALKNAQVKLMKQYSHPYYWSPFLLVGNWM
ncbi:MAG: CHAT domain-containing protein, partial [Deltaproteobacteria bacterium]